MTDAPAKSTRILHRQIAGANAMPRAVGGRGIEIIDATGRAYIDGSGGAAVSSIGHGHPHVRDAIRRQLDKIAYAHTSFFTTDVAEQLADTLISDAPQGLDHVYYVSGGSEAIEASLKLARQYFTERGEKQRVNFVARRQSYHGNTLGALAVGGNLWRRQQFAPMLFKTHHVAPPYAYRDQREGENSDQYAERLADEFDAKCHELGPETIIAFVAETVGGATQGCTTAPAGYFRRIREICDRYGILLILDEVMCGMGRTGTLHACEQEGIAPDIMAIAKGLGGGYQPIGAVMLSGKIFNALEAGSGFFQHGHTYLAHPLACAAAQAVQEVIRNDNLLANVRKQGAHLERRLRERFGNNPHVGDIRGRGLFWAVEYVTDRSTKTPFDPALKLNGRVKREAMERGLACYAMPGTIDGKLGDHNMLAPPFICTENDIDTIVERFGEAMDAAIASVGRSAAST
ncbi:MAG: aspartate aminotransferase family protein [Proteobacteria bacterium]|nr:aspartate aminotransferase family protein [Pseudomonadota bacterium]